MKKTLITTVAALFIFAATVNAQTDTTVKKDQYNNWTAETYKLQPMPSALTTDKIFPAIGKYEVTTKEGETRNVMVTLDEANKGIVWINGLPDGMIKANLKKSPAIYKIPAQKIGEGKEAKDVAEGVMIYDKDANSLSICIGCTYNAEDPALAFAPAPEPVVEEVKTTKTAKKTAAPKVAKIKTVHYTGSKVVETTAATSGM